MSNIQNVAEITAPNIKALAICFINNTTDGNASALKERWVKAGCPSMTNLPSDDVTSAELNDWVADNEIPLGSIARTLDSDQGYCEILSLACYLMVQKKAA